MTPIEEQFEAEWVALAADHNLTIEQGQACLDTYRRQFDTMLTTCAELVAQSFKDEEQ